MLDVHPPHASVHGWRDFFIHIATIVIGLLIAIGLEQTVEGMHHRHIVREARENIRHELEANQKQAGEDIGYVQTTAKQMQANMDVAGAMLKAGGGRGAAMHFGFAWSSFEEAAWLSARDSGALTYMPTAEVQLYADCYLQQELVNRQAVDIFTHQAELVAPLILTKDSDPFPADDLQMVRHQTAVTYMRLNTLQQLVGDLKDLYATTLKK